MLFILLVHNGQSQLGIEKQFSFDELPSPTKAQITIAHKTYVLIMRPDSFVYSSRVQSGQTNAAEMFSH